MPPRSKADLYAAIRRDVRSGAPQEVPASRHPAGPLHSLLDETLRQDLDAPHNQRHTTRRIFDRLINEHDATDLPYGIVRHYITQHRDQIRFEAGRGPATEVFVPQTHPFRSQNRG